MQAHTGFTPINAPHLDIGCLQNIERKFNGDSMLYLLAPDYYSVKI